MSGIFGSFWFLSIRKAMSIFVASFFIFPPVTIYAQPVLGLPEPGSMVMQSQAFVPVVLRAVRLRPDQPLVFDFVVDNGDTGFEGEALKTEIEKLAKYFLATLTIPRKDLWVNLSPYEKDRITADEFGQTEMGRDMLAQDYILKQLASSLVNPDTALGRAYWDKLYAKATEVLGTAEIPMDTFNKVWIVPDEAVIYEKGQAAILGETRLKLMMEEDYLAMKKSGASNDWAKRIQQQASDPDQAAASLSSQVMREIILPEIEKEVNTGKNFAPLRQIFSALILATWYKEAVKDSLISRMYEDQKKIAGVDIQDANMREKIFEQYVAAYKKGVFDFIREDLDAVSGEALPRRYFSGGVSASDVSLHKTPITGQESAPLGLNLRIGKEFMATFVAGKFAKPTRISGPSSDPDPVDELAGRPGAEFAMATTSDDPDIFVKQLPLAAFDAGYLRGLYAKFQQSFKGVKEGVTAAIPKIGDNFIPSALMSKFDRERVLGTRDYETQIRLPQYLSAAKEVVLWSNPMNGGLGTSVARQRYLWQNFNRENLGAKATDLYYPLDLFGFDERGSSVIMREHVSIVELQLLQALSQDGAYRMHKIQSFVNDESKVPMENFLNTVYLFDRLDERPGKEKRTYRQMFSQGRQVAASEELLLQAVLPVIDSETGLLTDEFLAPGGHGQLGTQLLQEAPFLSLPKEGVQIRALFNGDGVNNEPDPYVAGWMAQERIPIAMVTTTRTPLDAKGGIMGIFLGTLKRGVAAILEIAQAKEAGQEALFLVLGLTEGDRGGQFFNTNTALTNDTLLSPFLRELKHIIGAEKFAEVTTPDLIQNKKEKGPDKKKVIQMEGALGSALLNLNRFVTTTDDMRVKELMRKYGFDRLVYFVNFGANARINAFTPVKYSWDHWLYAYSGHFSVDPNTWRLVNNVGSHLPGFTGMDKYYEGVQNMIDSFGRANVNQLDEISITGVVKVVDAVLKGKVVIENNSGREIDLNATRGIFPFQDGRIVLDNVHVLVDQQGQMTVKSIVPAKGAGPGTTEKAMQEDPGYGGIDFDNALQNIRVERTGEGINVHVDPAEMLRIQAGGFEGLSPIIIEVVPVQGILPALGLVDNSGGRAGV